MVEIRGNPELTRIRADHPRRLPGAGLAREALQALQPQRGSSISGPGRRWPASECRLHRILTGHLGQVSYPESQLLICKRGARLIFTKSFFSSVVWQLKIYEIMYIMYLA